MNGVVQSGDTSDIGWPVCLKLFKSEDNHVYFNTQVVLDFLGLDKHIRKNGFKFIDKFLVENSELLAQCCSSVSEGCK